VATVAFDGATKWYGSVAALTDLSLEIEDGELLVLVGPSGSGKTTALRLLAGLESLSSGHVRIGDRVVDELAPRDRDIAMVFQDYALYPQMSVFDNMAFGLRTRKFPRDEIDRRVRRAAGSLGLGEMLRRKPRELSGGQRQRVALGRALVREPRVFLMDEPLSNLDAKLRVQMRVEIARIQRELGVTTVFVTHDQTEAMTLGQRVAVMKDGVLQQVDTPERLYARPVNVFVAGFIGSPAMNMVHADLSSEERSLFASFGEHRLSVGDEALAIRPALRAYEGRRIILGIRPEDMVDGSLEPGAPSDRRLDITVELREDLGSQVYLYFTLRTPPVLTEDTRELAGSEVVAELEAQARAGTSTFTAGPNSETPAREGDPVSLSVDTRRLHFFDPESGAAIYGET
jgi:multiple sugar transport system ATP-binding protein